MDQLIEFASDNLFLFVALFAVFAMLIKAEYEHQTTRMAQLSPARATRLLNDEENVLVLDVRSQKEFADGHIKSARHIPLQELNAAIDGLAGHKSGPVLVYCNSGNVSAKAGRILHLAGFERLNNLSGGILAWKEAGLPLTKK